MEESSSAEILPLTDGPTVVYRCIEVWPEPFPGPKFLQTRGGGEPGRPSTPLVQRGMGEGGGISSGRQVERGYSPALVGAQSRHSSDSSSGGGHTILGSSGSPLGPSLLPGLLGHRPGLEPLPRNPRDCTGARAEPGCGVEVPHGCAARAGRGGAALRVVLLCACARGLPEDWVWVRGVASPRAAGRDSAVALFSFIPV